MSFCARLPTEKVVVNAPLVAFFNHRDGLDRTSLLYHVAWMLADEGLRVLVADLDPQAHLTATFLDETRLEEMWEEGEERPTIHGVLQPLVTGVGDLGDPRPERIHHNLSLLVGDFFLSSFEDELSKQWTACLEGEERAFRVSSAIWRALRRAEEQDPELDRPFKVVLLDLGPNLGAINRAACLAADHVVIPLAPDLFSLQGLHNLGPTLRTWRREWSERLDRKPRAMDLPLPEGRMQPAGYVVLQHAVRLDRLEESHEKWIARIPLEYHGSVLDETEESLGGLTIRDDPECLALLNRHRTLTPLAQEARKPIFHLKTADGAMGAHFHAVQDAEKEFRKLARTIARKTGLPEPG